MDSISSIITILSKEEKRKFRVEMKQRNKRSDVKNIELFQLLDTPIQQDNLDIVLYGKSSKGAYHALRKRLHDSLIDFIAAKNFEQESSKEMSALKLVLASRTFFQHQQFEIAFKSLAKAELIANKYDLFSILNEIYQTQILFAHLNNTLDFKKLIKKYQKNKLNIQQEDNLNLFYASIQDELSQKTPEVSDIIDRNLNLFNISITKNLSYTSLLKILQISNQVAHATRDYYAVLQFIEDACLKIETSERIQDTHLHDHLQILYYLSNTYFRIKKFKKSSNYLDTMNIYMQVRNKKYDSQFYPQYALIKNLLLIYSGKNEEAISNLQEFDFKKYKNKPAQVLDLKLTQVVALFLQKKFKEAFQVYLDFNHSDTWYIKKTGYVWVIQKNLIEILILIELNHFDLLESRLKSFKKKHRVHLIEHNVFRILDFLNLITVYFYKTEKIHSKEFMKKVDDLLNIKSNNEDVFTISFYAWLKSKIENTEIYKTCLDLIDAME